MTQCARVRTIATALGFLMVLGCSRAEETRQGQPDLAGQPVDTMTEPPIRVKNGSSLDVLLHAPPAFDWQDADAANPGQGRKWKVRGAPKKERPQYAIDVHLRQLTACVVPHTGRSASRIDITYSDNTEMRISKAGVNTFVEMLSDPPRRFQKTDRTLSYKANSNDSSRFIEKIRLDNSDFCHFKSSSDLVFLELLDW